MATKKVEWKDTKFPFSIDYDFSLFVRNRCVFFHSLSRNIRKMINYAANFTRPYQICVIYVYGTVKADKIQNLLDNVPNNIMCLIASAITSKDVNAIAEHRKWLDKLKSGGLRKITNPGHQKSQYCKTMVDVEYGDEPSELWYKTYNHPQDNSFYSIYLEGMAIMKNNAEASERISKVLTSDLDVLANFPNVRHSISGALDKHDAELIDIIRHLYPYGVEADTTDVYAIKMLKSRKIVEAVVAGAQSKDIDNLKIHFSSSVSQMCFWNNTTFGADQCVEWLTSQISNALAEKGCICISRLWVEFSKPPFGAYPTNWYNYLFAVAVMRCYKDGMFYGNALTSQIIDKSTISMMILEKCGYMFCQNEQQNEFRLLFAKLFDLVPHEPVQRVIGQARSWVSDNIKWTALDWVDHNLYEILSGDGDISWESRQEIWYEFGYEIKYLPWIKENFSAIYSRIRSADNDFKSYLAAEYGSERAELFCRHYTVKGSAVGWLHSADMVNEKVVSYMKEIVCAECGKIICKEEMNPEFAYEHFEYDHQTHKNEIYRFSKKDIIGLNKKLMGRNNTNCFCIPCLCEIANTTPVQLWEMMNDFKEQGCTLFQ
ncbi:MAG: hypothetical protein ACI4Q4_00710 [Oscillospiraceae bacterium]